MSERVQNVKSLYMRSFDGKCSYDTIQTIYLQGGAYSPLKDFQWPIVVQRTLVSTLRHTVEMYENVYIKTSFSAD